MEKFTVNLGGRASELGHLGVALSNLVLSSDIIPDYVLQTNHPIIGDGNEGWVLVSKAQVVKAIDAQATLNDEKLQHWELATGAVPPLYLAIARELCVPVTD
jgi:hypothetical protein